MGKQELFTYQSPQKLKILREHALIALFLFIEYFMEICNLFVLHNHTIV